MDITQIYSNLSNRYASLLSNQAGTSLGALRWAQSSINNISASYLGGGTWEGIWLPQYSDSLIDTSPQCVCDINAPSSVFTITPSETVSVTVCIDNSTYQQLITGNQNVVNGMSQTMRGAVNLLRRALDTAILMDLIGLIGNNPNNSPISNLQRSIQIWNATNNESDINGWIQLHDEILNCNAYNTTSLIANQPTAASLSNLNANPISSLSFYQDTVFPTLGQPNRALLIDNSRVICALYAPEGLNTFYILTNDNLSVSAKVTTEGCTEGGYDDTIKVILSVRYGIYTNTISGDTGIYDYELS